MAIRPRSEEHQLIDPTMGTTMKKYCQKPNLGIPSSISFILNFVLTVV